jgi:hypothetical protein
MRSAFSWFAEFCHSQRLSQFAASFIVTNAETSVGENCKFKSISHTEIDWKKKLRKANWQETLPAAERGLNLAWSAARRSALHSAARERSKLHSQKYLGLKLNRVNDPSAGSPTETLLRLLLPLIVKVYSTFQPKEWRTILKASPKYSPERSIGRSDGRCVQRAGT